MMIDYKYEMTEREIKIEKMQRHCKMLMELLEAYEELRGNPEVTEEELNAEIEKTNKELEDTEKIIIDMTWNR